MPNRSLVMVVVRDTCGYDLYRILHRTFAHCCISSVPRSFLYL